MKTSGVPEPLQELAFKEAIAYLRSEAATADRSATVQRVGSPPAGTVVGAVDAPIEETAFFRNLSQEAGVPEADLRDVLNLTSDGKVQVMTTTKDLGKSVAQQARTVVAWSVGLVRRGLARNP